MLILINLNSEELTAEVSSTLSSYFKSVNIVVTSNITEAKYLLSNDKNIKIIISDFLFKDGTVFDLTVYKKPIIILADKEYSTSAFISLKNGYNDCIVKDQGKMFVKMIPYYISKTFIKMKKINKIKNLSKSNKQFLASASHELRTPLNSILGFAQLLIEEEPEGEKLDKIKIIKDSGKYLLNIINDILDLSKIESGKILFEKINFLLINTIAHIQSIFYIQASDKKINFTVNIDETVPNLVLGDELRISQILINILSNSFKFTPENGKISLCCSYYKGVAHFIIEDTGIGIPKEKLKMIFKPFAQVDASTTRKYGGTGLGLTISKDLIKFMGGTIDVESEVDVGTKFFINIPIESIDVNKIGQSDDLQSSERNKAIEMVDGWISKMGDEKIYKSVILSGIANLPERIHLLEDAITNVDIDNIKFHAHQIKGFTGSYGMDEIYKFALDIYNEINNGPGDIEKMKKDIGEIKEIISIIPEEYFKASQKIEIQKTSKEGARILVAEDNPENQLLIRAFFKSINLNCDIAANGLIALEALRKNKYDILFLDMQMPVMDGLTTIKKIRDDEKLKNTYVVALTADTMKGYKERVLAAGCNDFLSKPIDKQLLIEKINSIFY